MTNNCAEFAAVGEALQFLIDYSPKPDSVLIFGDSKLAINMMLGLWKCRDDSKPYVPYFRKAIELRNRLRESGQRVLFQWIPREENQEADDLSKGIEREIER